MPLKLFSRLAKAAWSAFFQAEREAYETGSDAPLSVWERLYNFPRSIANWISRIRGNIQALVGWREVALSAPLGVPPNTRGVDALVQIGEGANRQLRTVRVYIEPDMTLRQFRDEVNATLRFWSRLYPTRSQGQILVELWRVIGSTSQ